MAPAGETHRPAPDDLHRPVLLDRVLELLGPALAAFPIAGESGSGASVPVASRPVVVDATVGMGGHLLALLLANPAAVGIGIDRDPDALAIAGERFAAAGLTQRVQLVHAVDERIAAVVAEYGPDGGIHGVLFDLGVSSVQLDRPDRGFAYAVDAPLDMRMDQTTGRTAADVLNTYPARQLSRMLAEYGEEKFAGRISAAIVRERAKQPFSTSARLVELVRDAIPAAARRTGGHPAKRTFQALRIEVNDELGGLRRAIPAAIDALAVGGRIVVLSYHSLEDRIVKTAIDPLTRSTSPIELPVELPGHEPRLAWLTRGVTTPTAAEVADNPRAASARLRAAQRIRKAAA